MPNRDDVRDAISLKNRVLVTGIFLASGAASLILQVLWFEAAAIRARKRDRLRQRHGGELLLRPFARQRRRGPHHRRVDRPLKISDFSNSRSRSCHLAVTAFLSHWSIWVGWLAPMLDLESPLRLPLMVALSLAILSLPTMLMGATLPFWYDI